jgi:hypothetical protein
MIFIHLLFEYFNEEEKIILLLLIIYLYENESMYNRYRDFTLLFTNLLPINAINDGICIFDGDGRLGFNRVSYDQF